MCKNTINKLIFNKLRFNLKKRKKNNVSFFGLYIILTSKTKLI